MKTLFLILLFAGLTFSQVPIYKTMTYQLDAANSDSVKTPRGAPLSGILMPTSIGDTLTFEVSKGDGTWYTLLDEWGSELIVIYLSSAANAVTLEPKLFYPWAYIRYSVTDSDSTGNLPFTGSWVFIDY